MKTKTLLLAFGLLFLHFSVMYSETLPASNFAGGDGSADNPYQISNLAEWRRLTTTPAVHQSYFVITSDIDAKESNLWKSWGANPDMISGPAPIGWNGAPFKGKINGNGHKISNIYISRDNAGNMGIFGATEKAKIENIIFDSVYVKGGWNSGILIGKSKGEDTITNVALTNFHFVPSVNASLEGTQNVGGIIGTSDGLAEINGCIVHGKMLANASSYGSLIGIANYINIKNCFTDVSFEINLAPASASNNITGLVAKATYCTISESYSISKFVYDTLAILPKAFLGENVKIGGEFSTQIANCKYNKDIIDIGIDIVGNDEDHLGITGLSTFEMADSQNFEGFDFENIWAITSWNNKMQIPIQKWFLPNIDSNITELSKEKFQIFPNPTRDVLHIKGNNTFSNYKILTLEGQVIMNGFGNRIDVSSLNAGIYFISYNQKGFKRFLKL